MDKAKKNGSRLGDRKPGLISGLLCVIVKPFAKALAGQRD